MGKVVASGNPRQLVHQVGGRGRIEHVDEVVLRDLGGPGQHIEVEVPPDHRCVRKHAFGLLAEPADREQITSRTLSGSATSPRSATVVQCPAVVLVDLPGLVQVAKHLANEERIAVRLPEEGPGQAGAGIVERVTCGCFHERDHTLFISPDRSCGRRRLSAECGKRFEQGMRAGQPAVPVGAEHQHPQRLFGCAEVTQQLQAGTVGPLEIVEDEYHRLERDHGQEADHSGEEHIAPGVRVGCSRGREVREPAPQGRDEPGQLAPVFLHMLEELLLAGVGRRSG